MKMEFTFVSKNKIETSFMSFSRFFDLEKQYQEYFLLDVKNIFFSNKGKTKFETKNI